MDEYIPRAAAIERAMPYCPDDDGTCSKANTDLRELLDEIEDIPAADVVARDCYDRLLAENDRLRKERPVVRCKDCKYSAFDYENMRYCKLVTYYNHVPDDWFCADGERKDGDGDGV